jgi:hypothetical protein
MVKLLRRVSRSWGRDKHLAALRKKRANTRRTRIFKEMI